MATCNVKNNAIKSFKDLGLIDDKMKVISPLFFEANRRYSNSAVSKYGLKTQNLMFDTEQKMTPRLERTPYYRPDDVKPGDVIATPNEEFFTEFQSNFDKKQEPVMKAGVEEFMKANPQLSKIGTAQQYSDYLDTIFPKSKVKEILYHGGPEQITDRFKLSMTDEGAFYNGIYFSNSLDYIQQLGEDASKDVSQITTAVINAEDNFQVEEPIGYGTGQYWLFEKYDSIMGKDAGQVVEGDVFAVREPSQIHILGNRQDRDAFRKYVENQKKEPTPSTIRYNLGLNPQVVDELAGETKSNVIEAIGAPKTPVVEQEYVQIQRRLDAYNESNMTNLQLLATEDVNGKITITDVIENTAKMATEDERVASLIERMRGIFPQIKYEFITQNQVADIAGTSFAIDNSALNSFYKDGTVYLVMGRFTENMIIEEFLHPFVDAIAAENPELYQSLLEEIRKTVPDVVKLVNEQYTNDRGFTQDDRDAEIVTRGLQVSFANKIQSNYTPQYRGLRKLLNAVLDWFKDLYRRLTGRPGIMISGISTEASVTDIVNLLDSGAEIKLKNLPSVARANLTDEERNLINEILETATEQQRVVVKNILDNNIVYSDEDHSYVDLTTLESYRSVTNKIKGTLMDEGKFEFNRNVGTEFDFIMNAAVLNRSWGFIEPQLKYLDPETARKFYDVFTNYLEAWRGTGTIVVPQIVLADPQSLTAGKLDLLLIDPNGVMDIIDLKTSLSLDIFGSKYDYPYNIDSEESVFYGGKLTTRQQHAIQQHAYKRMIEVNPKLVDYPVRSVKTMHFLTKREGSKVIDFEFQGYVDHTVADYTDMVNKVVPTQPLEKNRVFRSLTEEQSRPENREVVENIRTIVDGMIDKFIKRRAYFEEIKDTTRGKTVASDAYMERLNNIIALMKESVISGAPANAFYHLIKYVNDEVARHAEVIASKSGSEEAQLSYMLEAERDIIQYRELLFNPDNFLNNKTITKLANEAASRIENLLLVINNDVKSFVVDFVKTRTTRDLTREEIEQIVEQAEDISWDQFAFGDIANSKDAILANLDKAYKARRQEVLDFVDRLGYEITSVGNELARLSPDKLRMFDFMISRDEDGNITGFVIDKIGKQYFKKRRELINDTKDEFGNTMKYRPVYNIDGSVSQEDLDFNIKLKAKKDALREFNEAEYLNDKGQVVDGKYHKYTDEFKQARSKYQYLFKKLDDDGNVIFYEWRRRSGISDKQYNAFLNKYYNAEVEYLSPVSETSPNGGRIFKGRVTEKTGRFIKNEYTEIREVAEDGTDMRDAQYVKMMEATDELGIAQRNFYLTWTTLYNELLQKLPASQSKDMRNRLPIMRGMMVNNVKSKGEGFVKAFAKTMRSLNPFTIETYNETVILDEDGNIRKGIPIFFTGDVRSEKRIEGLENRIKEVSKEFAQKKIKYEDYQNELKKLKMLLRTEKSRISKDEISTDMVRNIIDFAHMAETYQVMSNFESSVQSILRTMKMRKYIKRSEAGNVVTSRLGSGLEKGTAALFGSDNALAVQRLEKWMDMVFYRSVNPFKSAWGTIARKLMRYMSLKGVGLNVFGQFNNYLMGNANNLTEAVGDQYFKRAAFGRAIKEYNTDFVLNTVLGKKTRKLKAMADGSSPYYEFDVAYSKYEALVKKYRMFRKMLSADLGGDFADRVLDAAYWLQESAEYNIQSKTGIAILMSKTFKNKVTGEEVSIFDAHSYDQETGKLILDTNLYEETDEMRYNTTNYIYEVNKSIHGNYAYEDRMVIQATLMGELLAQFHKWVYPLVKQQWGAEYYNENLGNTEGRIMSLWRLAKYTYDVRSLSDSWEMMSPEQRANVYKLSAQLAIFLGSIGLMILFARLADDDDDDETMADRDAWETFNHRLVNLFIYQSDRLGDEISAAFNPPGALQFAKNPIALWTFIGSAFEAIGATFNFMLPPFNSESDYFEKGVNKGRLKLAKEWGDIIPVLDQINRWRSFETVKTFYVR